MISIAFNGLKFINNKKEKEKVDNIFKKIFRKKDTNKENKEEKINKLIEEYQQTRDENIFNEIYNMYKDFIINKSKVENNVNINYESEYNLALYNAVLSFDVNNKTNASFNTYFMTCAKNQINVINNSLNAQKRSANKNTISIQMNNSSNDNKEATLEDIIEDKDSNEKFKDIEFNILLNQLCSKLKDDEQKAIKLFLKGFTLKEIGKILGNITAPAIFTKLRRLKYKKSIKKELNSLLYQT